MNMKNTLDKICNLIKEDVAVRGHMVGKMFELPPSYIYRPYKDKFNIITLLKNGDVLAKQYGLTYKRKDPLSKDGWALFELVRK